MPFKKWFDNLPKFSFRHSLTLLILVIWLSHFCYLRILSERDKHFSHLSSLERELSFRSEMAMYYSYFKDLVIYPNFFDALSVVTNDSLTEYPNNINALQRFNIYPELLLSLLYRLYISMCQMFNLPLMECWEVERGGGMPSVTSCEGFGEPAYFYTSIVFFINGFIPVFIFLFAYFLSGGSIMSALVSALCFYYNHRECTRVMWTPPLRESFAFPFVILQNLLVEYAFFKPSRSVMFGIVVCNIFMLTSWQFSQFVFLTQVFAMAFLYSLGYFDKCSRSIFHIIGAHVTAFFISVFLLFGNRFLLSSFYAASLLSFSFLILGDKYSRVLKPPVMFLFRNSLMLAATFSTRMYLITLFGGVEDDGHILDLLKTKLLSSYRTFHTQLYICAPEFDFLGWNGIYAISKTLLLPTVVIVGTRFVFVKIKPPHLIYHFVQLAAYSVMSLLIMRLKLFMNPFLCISISLVAAGDSHCAVIPNRICQNKKLKGAFLISLSLLMAFSGGAHNINEEYGNVNEFANWPLESLINYISTNTKPTDSFAGAMPTTAAIRLSASRPIANHPHYEDTFMRNRTMEVYTVYSRKSLQEIHAIFQRLKISYVVVETIWCENRRYGCALAELYDIVDSSNRNKIPACSLMISGKADPYFKLVFKNDPYYLLKVQSLK